MKRRSNQTAREESRDFNQVTHMMLSASLLGALMDTLSSDRCDSTTVRQFYDTWKTASLSKTFLPVNPGLILGYLYLAILFVQQKWIEAAPELLPNDPASSDWGLTRAQIMAEKEPKPSVRYVLRRIRNSLGHARVQIDWPHDVKEAETLRKVKLMFRDIDPKDPSNTFSIQISVEDAFQLAKKYHATAGERLAAKHGGTPVYDEDWKPKRASSDQS